VLRTHVGDNLIIGGLAPAWVYWTACMLWLFLSRAFGVQRHIYAMEGTRFMHTGTKLGCTVNCSL
jgi:hypothetical protein